ncbi:kinesin-like protein KIF6 [Cololabis saira]|uniref:kinesin-like protein KIF6 n=1 Tax=Cololabis saira TaxID=129043 RepID=UPI002AD54618|nr:kinesin-like protein KIF6 [Cololabis saira]
MVQETIQIFARIKPARRTAAVYSVDNEGQTGSSLEFVVPRDMAAGFVNNKRESYKFRFQKVFNQDSKQEEIFENIAKPVAESALAGYNGTIFAYGQTGSGKTFTITGGAERYSDRGIIPRTLSYLYNRFSQDTMVYTTHISYLEIYNEMGYDLLDSRHEASRLEDLQRVMIMEDADQNIHLRNLSLQQSANEEEALNLLFLGDTNRMIAETPTNQASTRSHCVFTVHLCRREPGSATVRRSKLHLVDLAGSDRVSKTGLNGVLLTEAKYINLSLHHLEQVIIALSEKNRSHIPYRNSMLTSLLRDSLGGNCMTTMIANIAVEKRNLDESISTCRFAQRVALIKNEAVLNEELDPALLIARLKREIQSLSEELAMVTGVQRDGQLTAEETCKLEELVKTYLDDPDPDVTLSLGSDMRKIQHCFSLLKMRILKKQVDKIWRADQGCSPPVTVREESSPVSHISPAEVAKLKEMLRQRDNEISILVKILKKEKKRADDAAAQMAGINNSHSLSSQMVSIKSEVSQLREENILSNHGGQVSTLFHFRHGNMETLSLKHEGQVFTMAELREGNVECHQADYEDKISTMGQLRDGNMKNQPADHRGRTSTIPQMREETHPKKYRGQVFTTAQLQEGNMYSLLADHSGRVSRPPQMMREGNMETHPENHGGRISTIPQMMREENVETYPENHGGRAIQYMKRGPQLSLGKQEAFEIFIRDHGEHPTIEDNKKLLKQRSAEAKGLGEQLNTARNRINELKTQLDTRRRQNAAQGVLGDQTQAEKEFDVVEENLRKQMKEEKAAFKSAIDRLKALKTEMEHLQLLLERVKFKIQKDFQKWWNHETSNLQESESGATAGFHTPSPSGALQTPPCPGPCAAGLIGVVNEGPADRDMKPHRYNSPAQEMRSVAPIPAVSAWINTSTNGHMTNSNSSSEQSTLAYSSVPLTGDHQVDADIQAFVRARQNLLSRTGLPQQINEVLRSRDVRGQRAPPQARQPSDVFDCDGFGVEARPLLFTVYTTFLGHIHLAGEW